MGLSRGNPGRTRRFRVKPRGQIPSLEILGDTSWLGYLLAARVVSK